MSTRITITRTRILSAGLLAGAALVLASCGSGGSASSGASPTTPSAPAAAEALVRTTHTPLGTVIVDGAGRTLYAFAKDTGPRSTCFSACAAYWPPFTATRTPKAAGSVRPSALSLLGRGDGSHQVALDGHPLYFFEGDRSAGQVNGQGLDDFGARWSVVSPSGAAVTSAPSAPSGGAGAAAGGVHGY
ncbi:MAG TPA: hypothetical protein VMT10_04235 [Solirubrobacteraceae bacterium]|nr:hypothetical protein [Solirubrobacteraceae bacterium]